MKHGFVKVACCTPKCKVANVEENTSQILEQMIQANEEHCKIVVFPELAVTSYSCGDLFSQELLIRQAEAGIVKLVTKSAGMEPLFFVGMPMEYNNGFYNVAVAFSKGKILGVIPKTFLPNYNEFYEARYFRRGHQKPVQISWLGQDDIWFGAEVLIRIPQVNGLIIGAEICEDLWTPCPPSNYHALAGATLIVNLSASDEITGKADYRRNLVMNQSARLSAAYLYASQGEGESTTDLVYGGHCLIGENGILLAESKPFESQMTISEVDISRLCHERRKISTFQESVLMEQDKLSNYVVVDCNMHEMQTVLTRPVDPYPFVPQNDHIRNLRCQEILSIQANGLKKRLEHTKAKSAVIGISGGLDSTLALIVTVRAFDLLQIPRNQILAVTMPGFGTTDRTYQNSLDMIRELQVTLQEINICEAVQIHFRDIGHDPELHDVTYENSQARERTQILMDLANKTGGLVIGTGDMSELALGWATYNGDHMSMYGVNVSIPKTLVRHLVHFYADECENEKLKSVLIDVLDTPVSPELLPPTQGKISQKTEELVGPYELHDFFLYYVLRFGFEPEKIYRLCKIAFQNQYSKEEMKKWLSTFYRRFFSQQFKRSCLPDGPKVGTVAVSPRGDLRMPSDADGTMWIKQVEDLM